MPKVTCGPFPWPIADEQVLAALEKAYHDGSWGVYHGPDCAALVEELCEYFGRQWYLRPSLAILAAISVPHV